MLNNDPEKEGGIVNIVWECRAKDWLGKQKGISPCVRASQTSSTVTFRAPSKMAML